MAKRQVEAGVAAQVNKQANQTKPKITTTTISTTWSNLTIKIRNNCKCKLKQLKNEWENKK